MDNRKNGKRLEKRIQRGRLLKEPGKEILGSHKYSTEGRTLALHLAKLGSILDIPYGTLCIARSSLERRTRSNP